MTPMTEAEWQSCDDLPQMLGYLETTASTRKLRLFGIACCERVRHWLLDARSQAYLECVVRHVDGLATDAELKVAHDAAWEAEEDIADWRGGKSANVSAWYVARAAIFESASGIAWATAGAIALAGAAWDSSIWLDTLQRAWIALYGSIDPVEFENDAPHLDVGWNDFNHLDGWAPERMIQVALTKHIFGNPFRRAPSPAWTATVLDLAQTTYHGTGSHLILADALEESGHVELANHFRGEAWHPKGCWAVDQILGKS